MAGFFRSLFKTSDEARSREQDRATPAPEPGIMLDRATVVRLSRALVVLGTEVWRARGRLQKAAQARANDTDRSLRHLESSIEKMAEALESIGLRADDASGRTWDERDPVKVLVFEPTAGLTRAKVLEVVKPTLYLGDALLVPGEVVVGVPPDAMEGAAQESQKADHRDEPAKHK
jgi:hypothetical protein